MTLDPNVTAETGSKKRSGGVLLAGPPRPVPPSLTICVLFSGRLQQAAWVSMAFMLWSLPFFAVVPLLVLIGCSHFAIKRYQLLRWGEATGARWIFTHETKLTVNEEPVYQMGFEFEDKAGVTHSTTFHTQTPEPAEDEDLETLLYDPGDPSYCYVLHAMPIAPGVDMDGKLTNTNPLIPGLLLVAPVTCALLFVAVFSGWI